MNQNQGAESTISFLTALAEMQLSEHLIREPDTETVVDEPAVLPDADDGAIEILEFRVKAEVEGE